MMNLEIKIHIDLKEVISFVVKLVSLYLLFR